MAAALPNRNSFRPISNSTRPASLSTNRSIRLCIPALNLRSLVLTAPLYRTHITAPMLASASKTNAIIGAMAARNPAKAAV